MPKNFIIICSLCAIIMGTDTLIAQTSTVLEGAYRRDGMYDRENNRQTFAIPYPYLRESDVMYTKRVWQIIDLKEKLNHPYYYPINEIRDRQNLFDVIKTELLIHGEFSAFGVGPTGDDEEFRYLLSRAGVDSILNYTDRIRREDRFGNRLEDSIITVTVTSDLITRYKI